MKKILASDNSLKIISVIIAIIIWMYITVVMDPSIEVHVRDLPVQFVGQEILESKGLSVMNESVKKVSIKVKGNRKRMGNNSMDSIIVKVDESVISEPGVHSLPVEVIIPFENQGITSQSAYTIDIFVEEMAKKSFDIEVIQSGALASGYVTGDIAIEPKTVTVKGPKSAIEKISRAAVKLSVNGEDVDIDKELPVSFFDAEGKDASSLDALITRITPSLETVKVHCPVLKTRTITPEVNFGWQGLPEGYTFTLEPKEISIYSEDPNLLKSATVSTEEIWIDKLVENEKIKVKLIVPSGIKVQNNIEEIEISIKKD